MKEYYVIDNKGCDEFTCGKYAELSEAIKVARNEWDRLTTSEKKTHDIEVRQYAEDIEDEECNNFDYDCFDWGYIVDWGNSLKDIVNMSEKEARQWADDRVTYNQCSIAIVDIIDNSALWKRDWWGCLTGIEECENPIEIGNGFYSDWEIA